MYFKDQQDDITRPWRCEPCGYSTSIASNLRIHLSSEKHAQAVRKLDAVFLCGICTKFTSETAEQLEQHVSRWRHVEEDFGLQQQADFYVCNLCNYQTQVNLEPFHIYFTGMILQILFSRAIITDVSLGLIQFQTFN